MPPRDRPDRTERKVHRSAARRRRRLLAVATLLAAVGVGVWLALSLIAGGGGGEEGPLARAVDSAQQPEAEGEGEEKPPARIERIRVGRGVRGAVIVRRSDATGPQPTVIFLHGWGLTERSDYWRWIRHLAVRGSTVIVPRYQRSERDSPYVVLDRSLAGVRTALKRAPVMPGTLVVAGHSTGAALAADYAASAASEGLPRPEAIFAVYPGRAILGYPRGVPPVDGSRIAPATRIVAMAGANDSVVGTAPAKALLAAATRVPDSRRRYVLVNDPGVSDHFGPTRSGSRARKVFWRRLDRLIALARR